MGLFSKKKQTETFYCPVKGRVEGIESAPDPAFAEKMMGDGIVVFPEDRTLYAPIDATVSFVFPTKHAIGLKTKQGTEVLLHVGIDTVKLEGTCFEVVVSEGSQVKRGDILMTFDRDYIEEHAQSSATPMIITNLGERKVHIMNTGNATNDTIVFELIATK